jgi:hypothetical protein
MPEEFRQILPPRPQLPLRQRLPLQPQNAVVAPLVSQVHSHRQPVRVGGKHDTWLCTGFCSSLSLSFATSSAITSLESRCTRPRAFAGFVFCPLVV